MQTEEFVPMLVFDSSKMKELRTGAKCLEEVIQNQVQAIQDAELAKRQEIANQKAAKTKVRWSEIRYRCQNKSTDIALVGVEKGLRRPTGGCREGGEGTECGRSAGS